MVANQLDRLGGHTWSGTAETLSDAGPTGWRTRVRLDVGSDRRPGFHRYHSDELVTDLRVALDGERVDTFATSEPNLAEFDDVAARHRVTGLLGELPPGRRQQILAGIDKALRNRPRAVVLTGEERPTRVHQQDLHPRLGQAAGDQRELGIVADGDPEPPHGRVEDPQAGGARDVPLLALEAGHHLLVLMPDPPRGAEQHGPVQHRVARKRRARGREDMDPVRRREAGVQRVAGGLVAGDLAQAGLQVAGHRGAAEARQLHRAVLGEDEQVAVGGLLDPGGDLGFVGVEVGLPVDGIGGGGDADLAHGGVLPGAAMGAATGPA